MEKAIKDMRDKMARLYYDVDYDELLTNHKDAINNNLKDQISNLIDYYAYASIL